MIVLLCCLMSASSDSARNLPHSINYFEQSPEWPCHIHFWVWTLLLVEHMTAIWNKLVMLIPTRLQACVHSRFVWLTFVGSVFPVFLTLRLLTRVERVTKFQFWKPTKYTVSRIIVIHHNCLFICLTKLLVCS